MFLESARSSDIPAIVDLVNRAFRGKGEHQSWNIEDFIDGPRIDEAAVRDDVEEDYVRLFVHRATAGGPIIGTVRLEPTGGGVWHIGMLSVSPDAQTHRLGRQLMEQAESYVREHRGRLIRLSVVNLRTALIAWYERRGYRLTGETMPFPYDNPRFGIARRDDLHFVMLEKTL